MSHNGDEQVREETLASLREMARRLALQGTSPDQIVAEIDGGELNEAERALLPGIANQAVEQARRSTTRSPGPAS